MESNVKEKVLLKDLLISEERVKKIAEEIQLVYPVFDKKHFVAEVIKQFPTLELTPRVKWIREQLKVFLPESYQKAVLVLLDSLPSHDDTTAENDFGVYIYAPYSDFVAAYGCTKENLQFSLDALQEMTKRFSAEDAIRYFINAFPKETFAVLLEWSKDADYHVRRLASEGTRPRLPWAQKITTSPEDTLPILDNLFFDTNRFVTRSVANHLNDLTRIRPDLVFATLTRWQKTEKQTQKEMDYIIKQALRNLIKAGDEQAISFLHLSINPEVTISNFHIREKRIVIGTELAFSFRLTAQKDEQLIIDYILYFRNKMGNGKNKKVFKLKQLFMKKNYALEITKKHSMKHMSTRRLYPGEHIIELQVNGKKIAKAAFEIIV